MRNRHLNTNDEVIFIVDSNDPDRLAAAKEELRHVMGSDELSDAALQAKAASLGPAQEPLEEDVERPLSDCVRRIHRVARLRR